MKKIENFLVLPILLMFVLPWFADTSPVDVHVSDTYYVIDNLYLVQWFAYVLLVTFLLHKVIRRKHGVINKKWALSHVALSILLTALIWLPAVYNNRLMSKRYIDYSNWDTFNQLMPFNALSALAICAFVILQVIFLVYFTIRIIRPPRTR